MIEKGVRWETYEDWKNDGFYVRRGEKSSLRNEQGVPLFSRFQVEVNEEDDEQ